MCLHLFTGIVSLQALVKDLSSAVTVSETRDSIALGSGAAYQWWFIVLFKFRSLKLCCLALVTKL